MTHDDAGYYLVSWGEWAVRVDGSTGGILDSPPLALGGDTSNGICNASASNGTDFLVAWNRNQGTSFGTRLTAGGNVLDPFGFTLASAREISGLSALTARSYLSFWNQARDGRCGVYGATIGTDGSVIPPNGAPYATRPCDGLYDFLAPTGGAVTSHRNGHALLVYDRMGARSRRIRGQVLSP